VDESFENGLILLAPERVDSGKDIGDVISEFGRRDNFSALFDESSLYPIFD